MCLNMNVTRWNFPQFKTPCNKSDSQTCHKNDSGWLKHNKITTKYQYKTFHTTRKFQVFSFHQKAAKAYWTEHIIADSLPYQRTVIMPIKHILYINNNRQLKWVLCQGVLVTQCAKEHTPCACGIVSLTPAIESFTRGSKLVQQTSSNQLKHLLTCWLWFLSLNCTWYTGTEPTCAQSEQVFLSTSWCVWWII